MFESFWSSELDRLVTDATRSRGNEEM
jgi:hypothetical protein